MKITHLSLATLAAASVALPLNAQPTDPYAASGATQGAYDAPSDLNTGGLNISAGLDIVSIYVFRGLETQDDGFIHQPWAEINTDLGDSGFDLTFGIWNSFGSAGDSPVGEAGSTSPSFAFETDLYVGTSYGVDQWTFGATLTGFYSPGGFFGDVEEIALTAEFDDSAFLEEWAFNPYALLAFEIRDENAGESEDIYFELGGAFNAPFIDSEDLPVTLTFPFALGFSIDDYFTNNSGGNEFFGFLKLGALIETPLDIVPAQYGSWTAHAGLDLFFYNGDANLTDSGSDALPVVRVGIALDY